MHTALVIYKNELGPHHREVGRILYLLASISSDQGKYAQAEPLYREALAIAENGPSPQPRFFADIQLALAVNSYSQGKFVQAELLLKQAAEVYINVLGLKYATSRLEQVASALRKREQETEATLIEEYIKRIQNEHLSS